MRINIVADQVKFTPPGPHTRSRFCPHKSPSHCVYIGVCCEVFDRDRGNGLSGDDDLTPLGVSQTDFRIASPFPALKTLSTISKTDYIQSLSISYLEIIVGPSWQRNYDQYRKILPPLAFFHQNSPLLFCRD